MVTIKPYKKASRMGGYDLWQEIKIESLVDLQE